MPAADKRYRRRSCCAVPLLQGPVRDQSSCRSRVGLQGSQQGRSRRPPFLLCPPAAERVCGQSWHWPRGKRGSGPQSPAPLEPAVRSFTASDRRKAAATAQLGGPRIGGGAAGLLRGRAPGITAWAASPAVFLLCLALATAEPCAARGGGDRWAGAVETAGSRASAAVGRMSSASEKPKAAATARVGWPSGRRPGAGPSRGGCGCRGGRGCGLRAGAAEWRSGQRVGQTKDGSDGEGGRGRGSAAERGLATGRGRGARGAGVTGVNSGVAGSTTGGPGKRGWFANPW